LAPAYLLLIPALAIYLDHTIVVGRGERANGTRRSLALALCGLLVLAMPIRLAHGVLDMLETGVPSLWRGASAGDLVQMREELNAAEVPSSTDVVYSSDPQLLYYLTGVRSRMSPRKHPYWSPQTMTDDLPRLMQTVSRQQSRVRLVWFRDLLPSGERLGVRDYQIPLEVLGEQFVLLPSYQGKVIDVYTVAPPGHADGTL
jgi:hypothetical protein